ncbi:MAG: hypothetical protein ACKVS6_08765 [Planctomycetota bacterium]
MSSHYLHPKASRGELSKLIKNGCDVRALRRRGLHYGYAATLPTAPGAFDVSFARESWKASRPILLHSAGARLVQKYNSEIDKTLELFEHLRNGGDFQQSMRERLGPLQQFKPGGAATDAGDDREIEKVFYHGCSQSGARVVARDLYAKLSWISRDQRDPSLRIRFSFGSERHLDWMKSPRRAVFADRYAEAAFPESKVISKNPALCRIVEKLTKRRVRYSERIIYNNAPGGGAVFHHDAEPLQIGVVYAQIAGETGWLALPKRTLASMLAKRLRRPEKKVLYQLDEPDAKLEKLLNADADFVRELVESDHYYPLRAGDLLLLPSNGPDDTAWHSVIALGDTPSLALSFAIFPRGRGK